jgi:hypothetical protein
VVFRSQAERKKEPDIYEGVRGANKRSIKNLDEGDEVEVGSKQLQLENIAGKMTGEAKKRRILGI